ncbi:MAG: hypothetical protein JWQ04_3453 [Pedosphaera sp.]|nr:hypothetical protein [Pedosphaera sp.]
METVAALSSRANEIFKPINYPMEPNSATEADSKYSWAEHLAWMEGVPDTSFLPASKKLSPATTHSAVWGLSLCLGLTLSAMWLSTLPFWPFTLAGGRHPLEPVMMAIVLGMVLSNIRVLPKQFQPGIKISIKKVLPLGIILLGARLNFFDILRLGFVGMAMSCFEIGLALALMWFLTRRLNLSSKLGTLLGVGTAICGGTAIVAVAPVIEAEEGDVVFSVATVTLLGLVAMFTLPVLAHLMMLSDQAFGIWAGLAIHQTPQVVAAGFAYSESAGATATIVKMSRVCLLAPVVFVIGLIYARNQAQKQQGGHSGRINYFSLFPKFVLGFLMLALLQTLGWLPDLTVHLPHAAGVSHIERDYSVAKAAQWGASFLITLSMAGVGLETKFADMKKTGWRPFAAGLATALVIAVAVLGLIKLRHIS